jgi:peptide methionine sulfoxide reductase msrA/msrB
MKNLFLLALISILFAFNLPWGDASTPGMKLDKEELKKKLTPLQFHIIQENGTERPFHNEYWNHKKPGIYVDVVSGEVLFSSLDKFESGTGWPSFTKPLEMGNVVPSTDASHGMMRVEIRSRKADSHLGHIFDDGPEPTGLRYCINSAALRFIPAAELDRAGYGKYAGLFKNLKKPSAAVSSNGKIQTATFAAGCFWGIEAIFNEVPGVLKVTSGYTGGTVKNPSYRQVCEGTTGHAEAVQIKFDPDLISYEILLDYFWRMHDPTTLNRQGPDIGTQYRSAIFYHDPDQKRAALKSKKEFDKSNVFEEEAVTRIVPATTFYPAEEYHQDYYRKNRGTPYCHRLRDK